MFLSLSPLHSSNFGGAFPFPGEEKGRGKMARRFIFVAWLFFSLLMPLILPSTSSSSIVTHEPASLSATQSLLREEVKPKEERPHVDGEEGYEIWSSARQVPTGSDPLHHSGSPFGRRFP